MNKKTVAVIAGVAVIGVAAWYVSHGAGAGPAAGGKGGKGAQPPTTVSVVSPQRQDVPVVVAANGTVSPLRTVELHPQTTAAIRAVHIKEGQFVKEGQLMFTLDDRENRANLDKAQAQVARDQASLADLERQYKRSQDLFAQKFIAQSAVDTLRSQVEATRALLQADQAAARATSVSAGYAVIRAPMAGRVGAINVYPGSLVQLATALTTITQLDPINVAFTLPESALAAVLAAQQQGKVEVEVRAAPDAAPVRGELSFIDNTVDASTGTIRVKGQFANRDASLWPGQYVNARVTVRTLKDAIVLPQNAIFTNAKGTYVYVMEADQSARLAPVAKVHAFGQYAAVTGLKGDEKVITDGKQNLRPGGKVRLADGGKGKGGKGAAPDGASDGKAGKKGEQA